MQRIGELDINERLVIMTLFCFEEVGEKIGRGSRSIGEVGPSASLRIKGIGGIVVFNKMTMRVALLVRGVLFSLFWSVGHSFTVGLLEKGSQELKHSYIAVWLDG